MRVRCDVGVRACACSSCPRAPPYAARGARSPSRAPPQEAVTDWLACAAACLFAMCLANKDRREQEKKKVGKTHREGGGVLNAHKSGLAWRILCILTRLSFEVRGSPQTGAPCAGGVSEGGRMRGASLCTESCHTHPPNTPTPTPTLTHTSAPRLSLSLLRRLRPAAASASAHAHARRTDGWSEHRSGGSTALKDPALLLQLALVCQWQDATPGVPPKQSLCRPPFRPPLRPPW